MDKYVCKVVSQDKIAEDIFSLWIEEKVLVSAAHSGQFVSVYTSDPSRLLPRPISICDLDKEKGYLRLVYRIAGEGTRMMSSLKAGDSIDILGPLGNGYKLDAERPLLLGGGIGIPPMLRLAKEFHASGIPAENINVVLGFRDEAFLLDEFKEVSTVYITSDSGSIGIQGNVLDGVREYGIKTDMIFACGPTPMLRAIKNYAAEEGVKAQISLEERMACGVGACLACVCESTDIDDHSKVHNKRICKDGPVFNAEEVIL
jgi:2-polyprenylphenol hydroxylase and related flavodoxin oxidoreductases